MPLNYKVHPALNEKFFCCTPPYEINFSDLPPPPPKWLRNLATLCRKVDAKHTLSHKTFQIHLKRHLKSDQDTQKLRDDLSVIYFRLTGKLDTALGALTEFQRTDLICTLTEDINQCTPGFINRVNSIVFSLQKSQSLDQLLYEVRKKIVDRVAADVVYSAKSIHAIHIWNAVTIIASKLVCIRANYKQDVYRDIGFKFTDLIIAGLKKSFKEDYTPFKIPVLLADRLHEILMESGDYTGCKKNEGGYSPAPMERIIAIIKRFLPRLDWEQCFVTTDLDPDYPCIEDLNWPALRQYFFNELYDKGYFNLEQLICRDLLEYVQHRDLTGTQFDNNSATVYITELFEKEAYRQLQDIQTDFPDYWQSLSIHPTFIASIYKLIFYLQNELQHASIIRPTRIASRDSIKTLALLTTVLHVVVSSTKSKEMAMVIVKPWIEGKDAGRALLLAAQYHHESAKTIFSFLIQHCSMDTIQRMLLATSSDGANALTLAVRHQQPDGVETLLAGFVQYIIRCRPKRIDCSKVIAQLLPSTLDDWMDCLQIVQHRPEAKESLLTCIDACSNDGYSAVPNDRRNQFFQVCSPAISDRHTHDVMRMEI